MATTINTYSVGLTLDAADYINKSTLAGNETRRLSRAIEDARTPMERFTLSQTRLDKALEKGAIDRATYNRLLDASKAKLDAATRSVDTSTKSVVAQGSAMSAMVGHLKALAAGYLGLQTVTKSIKLAIEAEQAAAAFEVLTGSVNNAKVILDQIRELSDVSPLSFSGVQNAAKTLLGFGVPVEKIQKSLQMLSDVSAGNEERFKALALVFAQVSAAGKLTGSDLLQFVNAGFNPLQEIAKRTGESIAELRDRMAEGAITTQEVVQAFEDATGAGGKFEGMTNKLADTMGGRLAIAMADLEKAGAKLGSTFEPILSALTEGFQEGTSAIDAFIYVVEKGLDGLGAMAAVLGDVVESMSALATFGMLGDIDSVRFEEWLDRLDKRDKDRAQKLFDDAIARTMGGRKFDASATNEIPLMAGTESIAEEVIKSNEAFEKSANDRHKALIKSQKESDDAFTKATSGVAERLADMQKENERIEELFVLDVEKALKAALDFFEAERQRDAKIRSDVQRGPGVGIEVGSEQAAKFMADQVNRGIGVAAVPDRPTPGEKEIAEKTKELLLAQRESNVTQQLQLQTQVRLLEEFRENKFTRIR